ncbi:hypothetical protein SAMN05444392_10111 [Seinonella peptonophila]|uniref:Transcriptional regulator TetR C-terminal Firmicutes type domain-containing protein n=1 Tax=Seinonella peptonophila TaxID=112248 RepID=A0A1M4SK53_9BACL|nr:hypothetical protein [Seinonella peptonophila]SHE32532.1 hypothetical protein SAMN05444392_10111 [Seinonella peptonophila]
MNPLFERAVQEEVMKEFLTWFKEISINNQEKWVVPSQTVALMISWTVFGVAVEWSQGKPEKISIHEIADHLLDMITKGADCLIPKD